MKWNWVFKKNFSKIGDEIFTINGTSVSGLTHQETISMFKEVKQGDIVVTIGRRAPPKKKTITISTEDHWFLKNRMKYIPIFIMFL